MQSLATNVGAKKTNILEDWINLPAKQLAASFKQGRLNFMICTSRRCIKTR